MFLEKTGDNPGPIEAKKVLSPFECFKNMAAKNPVIELLRKPGAIPSNVMPSTTRSGEIHIRLNGNQEEELADLVRVNSKYCRLSNIDLRIRVEIEICVLLLMVTNGQTKWVSKSVKTGETCIQLSFYRHELKEFLQQTGLMQAA